MPFPAPTGTPVAVNGILPSETVNEIAVDITKTINAVDGDTLTPTNPIVVDSGVVRFANASTLDVESLLTLSAPGVANLSGSVNVYGNTTFDATTVSVSGTTAVSFGGSTTTTWINGWIGTFQAGTIQNLSGAWSLKTGATATHESGSTTTFATGSTVSLGASVNLATNARTYTKSCRSIAMFDATYWDSPWLSTTIVGYYNNKLASGSTGARLTFDVDVPDASTITEYHMWVDPPNTHITTPGTQPSISLWQVERSTGAATQLSTVTDAQPDKASYEARHLVSKTGVAHVIDTSAYWYFLIVTGESGADLQNDGKYEVPYVVFTRQKIGEER